MIVNNMDPNWATPGDLHHIRTISPIRFVDIKDCSRFNEAKLLPVAQ
jgi:hypothetical protein